MPQCNIVLLSVRILGLFPLTVQASSVCACTIKEQRDTVAVVLIRAQSSLNDASFDGCQCYLRIHSAVVNHHMMKIAAGE